MDGSTRAVDKGKQRALDQDDAGSSRNSYEGGKASSEASLEDLEATESTSFRARPKQHARALSLSGLANLALLHIPLSVERVDPLEAQTEIKHLSLIGAIALTVGSQVGGGIFSAPVSIAYAFPSCPMLSTKLFHTGHRNCTLWERRSFTSSLARFRLTCMDWRVLFRRIGRWRRLPVGDTRKAADMPSNM
jgi:hypothetical protein